MATKLSENNKIYLIYNSDKIKSRFPIFLNIGSRIPIALFGGRTNAAAIDSKGSIIFIPYTAYNSQNYHKVLFFESFSLPNGEKTIGVACCNDFIIALSSNGKVFKSSSNEKLNFVEVSELLNIRIVHISGVDDQCFVVSKEGNVFVYGKINFGEFGIENRMNYVSEFTKISKLNKYKTIF